MRFFFVANSKLEFTVVHPLDAEEESVLCSHGNIGDRVVGLHLLPEERGRVSVLVETKDASGESVRIGTVEMMGYLNVTINLLTYAFA